MAVNIELHLDHLQLSQDTHDWITDKMSQLEKGYHDITQAYLSVKQLSGKPTVNKYEAKLVLYHKPENIVGSTKSEMIPEAIQNAFVAAERQLRKARDIPKDRRKRAVGVRGLTVELPVDIEEDLED